MHNIKPSSATHNITGLMGLFGLISICIYIKLYACCTLEPVIAAILIIAVTTVCMVGSEIFIVKVYKRSATSLNINNKAKGCIKRVLIKLVGFSVSVSFVLVAYWLLPEYHGSFYAQYYRMLKIFLPIVLLGAPIYIYYLDRIMVDPYDSYYYLGSYCCGIRSPHIPIEIIEKYSSKSISMVQHLLGWFIKGFFLPLMFTYMCNDIQRLMLLDYTKINDFSSWFDLGVSLLYFVDVSIATIGYIISLRVIDAHIRSSEPTMVGFVVALICYEPFWSCIGKNYLAYHSSYQWKDWLINMPWLYYFWGISILIILAIYVWATICFGPRFSNLTNRGIITNGPYSWTKHPAYISKNIAWWMIAVPFVFQGSWLNTLRHCLLLLGVNIIYVLRAKTEERHLANDPVYLEYARWIEVNGIFRKIGNFFIFKWLKFDPNKKVVI